MAIHLGTRARKAIRYTGIGVAALIVFVFALQLTFPYRRVKQKIEEALSEKYDVTIGDVDRGFLPGRVYFKNVSLRTRQSKPDEPVTTFYIEKLKVDLGIFALLRGKASIDFDAAIAKGHIKGNVTLGKKGTKVDIDGTDLPGDRLPMRAVLGLPMTGKIEFSFALDLPTERLKSGRIGPNWTKAEGSAELSCPSGCTFGDGKTRLKPLLQNSRNQVMVGEGIDFGKVDIDSLALKAVLKPAEGSKPAKLELQKFDARSHDGELKVDFAMTLAEDINQSVVDGCLRFKGSDTLLKKEPKTYAAIQTTGAELRSDGLFHIKLTDHLGTMKRLNLQCGPGTQVNNGENFGNGAATRPTITVQPQEEVRPIPPPTIQPPAPPPATPPPPPPAPTGEASGAAAAPPSAATPTGAAAPTPEAAGSAPAGGAATGAPSR